MPQLKVDIDPGEVGLDAARLARIDTHFRRYVDDRRLPGWLLAVSRHGELAHLGTYGQRDIEAGLPVETDTIWRIYSMTKPITAVAALVLWEQGGFELNDLVRHYIPSFEGLRVWRGGTAVRPETEPVTEEMRVWHLFTHTSGLTYGFMQAHPVDTLYRQAGFEWGVPTDVDLAGVCDGLAKLPLLFQPGTEWNYGMSTDVLGMVVEAASGVPFAEFVQSNVLDPLGMDDTMWSVPDEHADRLAALYVPTPGTGEVLRYDTMGAPARVVPKATMGGGGLCSTAGDYIRFAEMLRRRGELDGVRILAPGTVDYMASNHLPGNADLTAFGRPLFSETTFDGVGFGLGVSVTVDPLAAKVPGSVGDHGWGGAASTAYWIDPARDLSVVFMTQLLPSNSLPLRNQLKQLVAAAVIDT
ncbi:MAG: beta-lactamase family protein [Actinomycetota bacterium]|nr:beta-lactamase family protein [Acidimicrobiia bacterium]MDQ3469129.1 beta-lactamase family protein [Actinomycetota bacterium]